MVKAYDIAIIGAGPAGLFAVFQAGMLGMNCAVIDTLEYAGGQCAALYPQKPIYDIPAYPTIIAEDLISNLVKQASPFKPEYFLGHTIEKIDSAELYWQLKTSKGTEIRAKAIIIAAGCGSFEPNRLPIENALSFENVSLFYFVDKRERFVGKNIIIAGGGDSAVDWAIQLSKSAKKVYLVHRREKFRAFDESLKKLEELVRIEQVELVIPYQIKNVYGKGQQLEEVVVEDLDGNSKILQADYLLPFYGLKMEIGAVKNWGLNLNKNHIEVKSDTMETNLKNVYAIGDITYYPNKLKLILTGFAEAALAVHQIQKVLFPNKAFHFEYSTTKGLPSL